MRQRKPEKYTERRNQIMIKKKMIGLAGAVFMTGMIMTTVMAAEEADVIGTWYLNVMEMEGTEMNPAAMGMEMSLEVSEDRTALVKMTDEEDMTGTWEIEDGVFMFTDETDTVMKFTFAEEKLTTEEDGIKMIFGKEKAEAEIFEPGTVVAEPSMEDFDGNWNVVTVDLFGMQMPVAMAEFEMSLTIENGKATMHYNDGSSETDAELTGVLEGDTLTLTAPEAAEEEMYTLFDLEVLNLRLHESGVLSYSDKDFSETETEEIPAPEAEAEDTEEPEEEVGYGDTSFAVYFEKN